MLSICSRAVVYTQQRWPMTCQPTQTFDIDLPALREKYRQEAQKRHRKEGFAQYLEMRGELEEYFEFDPYSPYPPREPVSDEIDVVIMGGGFAGLNVAGRLKEAGVDNIRIIDRGGDFGGTWYWNRYPGVQCDVESYTYMPLLQEMGYMPRDRYSYGPEIFEYCQQIGRHFDLYEHALFGTLIDSLRWDDAIKRWRVGTRQGDDIRARFVVMAPGPLNRPKLPGVPGIKSFKGHSFHTTRWDYDYTGGDWKNPVLDRLGDKRIGIIGTGATAIQCVPFLAKYAQHLTVFQRTPSYIDDRGNRPTDPEWARSLQPGWQNERMLNFHIGINEVFDRKDVDLICDGWSELNRNIQARREAAGWPELTLEELMAMREEEDYRAMERIRRRVDSIVKDKATADILKPWYRFLCKRPCFNDDYLPTFNRPNVTLVDVSAARGVERVTETGIVANGVEHELDCIIYASGFETDDRHATSLRHRYDRGPGRIIDLRSLVGRLPHAAWDDGPQLSGIVFHRLAAGWRVGQHHADV